MVGRYVAIFSMLASKALPRKPPATVHNMRCLISSYPISQLANHENKSESPAFVALALIKIEIKLTNGSTTANKKAVNIPINNRSSMT